MNELKEITFAKRKTGEGRAYFRPTTSRSNPLEINIGGILTGIVEDGIEREYELYRFAIINSSMRCHVDSRLRWE